MSSLFSAANTAAPNHLLSRKQAAAWLNISVRSLDALVATGQIVATRIGKRVLFAPEDLQAFVDRSKGGAA